MEALWFVLHFGHFWLLFVIFNLMHNDAVKKYEEIYKGTVYVRYVAQYFSKIDWLTDSDLKFYVKLR